MLNTVFDCFRFNLRNTFKHGYSFKCNIYTAKYAIIIDQIELGNTYRDPFF